MTFDDSELEAYLDESLDPARAAELESAVRSDLQLLKRLSKINGRRDAGIHTLGEIWRRNQVGVPSADEMTDFLTGKLSTEESDYIEFRIKELKCVFTLALLHDIEAQLKSKAPSQARIEKIVEKSADLLQRRKRKRN